MKKPKRNDVRENPSSLKIDTAGSLRFAAGDSKIQLKLQFFCFALHGLRK